jgi:hypothetical protein
MGIGAAVVSADCVVFASLWEAPTKPYRMQIFLQYVEAFVLSALVPFHKHQTLSHVL